MFSFISWILCNELSFLDCTCTYYPRLSSLYPSLVRLFVHYESFRLAPQSCTSTKILFWNFTASYFYVFRTETTKFSWYLPFRLAQLILNSVHSNTPLRQDWSTLQWKQVVPFSPLCITCNQNLFVNGECGWDRNWRKLVRYGMYIEQTKTIELKNLMNVLGGPRNIMMHLCRINLIA